MYRAYVVSRIGDAKYNVILGDDFETVDKAKHAVETYYDVFGDYERARIEPSTEPLPETVKEDSIFETLKQIFMIAFGDEPRR